MNSGVYTMAESAMFRVTPLQMVLGGLLLLQLIRLCFRRYQFLRKVSWIPGPSALPLLGNALSLTGGQDEFLRLLIQCSKDYGRLFRLWIGTRIFVFLGQAEDIQPILNSMDHIDKSHEYGFLGDWLGQGLITATGRTWQRKRKLLTPAFHSNILDDFAGLISQQTDILLEVLGRQKQREFDVVPFLKRCALDIICVTAMGKEIGAQAEKNSEYVHAVEEISDVVQKRFVTPWLKPEVLFKLSSWGRKQAKALDAINQFVGGVIVAKKAERKIHGVQCDVERNGFKGRKTFLDLLLDANDDGAEFTEDDIEDEVNTFMFAGHDTTATAVSWCLYVLGHHPDAQEAIVAEYRDATESDGNIYQKLKKLQYLELCIKEVMRLYPVTPIIARNIREPVQVTGGRILPAGTTALIVTSILHRDPRFFPDPNEFRPERFSLDKKEDMHPFAYIPFSAGPRNCIGQRFAQLSTKLLVAKILSTYKVTSIDRPEKLNLVPAIVLKNEHGIRIKLETRSRLLPPTCH